ncbi:MAG: NfeD family protein [Clostridia bacterium]|nr:NfeD family protein [Clostridia bacterium]
MPGWFIWLVIAGIFTIVEIATVGFFIIWFGVAAVLTALFSLFMPEAYLVQVVFWAITSVLLVLFTKKFTDKVKPETTATNVYSIIGKRAVVTTTINNENSTGQIKVDGDVWSAKAEDYDEIIEAGEHVEILRIDGVKVIVKKAENAAKAETKEK